MPGDAALGIVGRGHHHLGQRLVHGHQGRHALCRDLAIGPVYKGHVSVDLHDHRLAVIQQLRVEGGHAQADHAVFIRHAARREQDPRPVLAQPIVVDVGKVHRLIRKVRTLRDGLAFPGAEKAAFDRNVAVVLRLGDLRLLVKARQIQRHVFQVLEGVIRQHIQKSVGNAAAEV